MGKAKKSRSVKLVDYSNTSTRIVHSPDSDHDLDLKGDSSWVIVRKQRVVILVPSLPMDNTSLLQLNPGSRESEVKRVNKAIDFPVEDDEHKDPVITVPKKTLQFAQTKPNWVHTLRGAKISRTAIPGQSRSRGGVCMPLSQGLRALNLERKLERAGGLSRWLVSLGLGQFVRLFERKGLGKFHLVNLTMKSLKDMGANAVGPRRKLIHAIDCICQPHCFVAL